MTKKMTAREKKIIEAGADIFEKGPAKSPNFLHAALCQAHLPRSPQRAREYVRTDGDTSLRIEAGSLFDGKKWVPQPLPFGVMPRLILMYLNTYAIRYRTTEIPVQDSARAFIRSLGLSDAGGKRGTYGRFREQVNYLAACRMQLGYRSGKKVATTAPQSPIEHFEAWLESSDDRQQVIWPGVMHLSPRYYESLLTASVPLDPHAIGALRQSSLDLDVYTWFAHRLHRVAARGQLIRWQSLRNQFGGDYHDPKNFKKAFKISLARVAAVYPAANFELQRGALLLKSSPPPIPRAAAFFGKK